MSRYCKFETAKTSAGLEVEQIRPLNFDNLNDKEGKLKLLDALSLNENLTVEELLKTLQDKSPALTLASGPDSTTSFNIVSGTHSWKQTQHKTFTMR